MTVDFENMERPVLQYETYCYKPFVGYISPNGDLIDFNKPFGESGHDGWDNIVTTTFLKYVRYNIKGLNQDIEHHLYEKYTNLDELIYDLDNSLKYRPYGNMSTFIYELLLFFKKAYSNRNFFKAIDRKIEVTSERDFVQKNPIDPHYYSQYTKLIILELMQHFKDIAVCYLGYDSFERFQPNGKMIEIPHDSSCYISYLKPNSSYFYYIPRIITTSCTNINERFFNFLIMNWSIHSVPRYCWNEKTLRYEKVDFNSTIYTEKEGILEKEIQSIKRLVPLKDRYKYFK